MDSPWAYVCLNCGRAKAETQAQCATRIGGPTYKQRMEMVEERAKAEGNWLKKPGPARGFKQRREAIHIAEILVEMTNLALADVLGYLGPTGGAASPSHPLTADRAVLGTAT